MIRWGGGCSAARIETDNFISERRGSLYEQEETKSQSSSLRIIQNTSVLLEMEDIEKSLSGSKST